MAHKGLLDLAPISDLIYYPPLHSFQSRYINLLGVPQTLQRVEGGRGRQQASNTHTQTFPALCREVLADREKRGWGRRGARGQLTVSARGSLPAPSSLGVHLFWIMGIASVGSTPAFSLSSRDFLDSKEEWEGAMRSHYTLPLF